MFTRGKIPGRKLQQSYAARAGLNIYAYFARMRNGKGHHAFCMAQVEIDIGMTLKSWFAIVSCAENETRWICHIQVLCKDRSHERACEQKPVAVVCMDKASPPRLFLVIEQRGVTCCQIGVQGGSFACEPKMDVAGS